MAFRHALILVMMFAISGNVQAMDDSPLLDEEAGGGQVVCSFDGVDALCGPAEGEQHAPEVVAERLARLAGLQEETHKAEITARLRTLRDRCESEGHYRVRISDTLGDLGLEAVHRGDAGSPDIVRLLNCVFDRDVKMEQIRASHAIELTRSQTEAEGLRVQLEEARAAARQQAEGVAEAAPVGGGRFGIIWRNPRRALAAGLVSVLLTAMGTGGALLEKYLAVVPPSCPPCPTLAPQQVLEVGGL